MERFFCAVAILVVGMSCCGAMKSVKGTNSGNECYSKIPKDIKGLVITGPRPRRNVIENLAPIICNWRKQCEADQKNGLTGIITLRLVIDKVGDIGILGYESTVKDSVYVENLISGLNVLDFDPWNDQPDNTIIEFPVELVK